VIEQIADGRTIYDDPASAFVASFVGENNAFSGLVTAVADGMAVVATPVGPLRARVATAARAQLKAGDRAMIFIRPEALSLANGAAAAEQDDRITGRVTAEEFEGPSYHLHLEGPAGVPIKTSLVNQGTSRASGMGAELTLAFDPMKAVALPAGELAADE
ncbi:MAG TPA: TOBE domain-containing protein, partial [Geminicoccaceae bacterium]|nr:TOBE domain-containing protein [Geminicoccaceae bacterium]